MTYRTRKKKKKYSRNKQIRYVLAKGKRKRQTVKTTEGESIFEAYFAVFIDLIGEQNIYKELTDPINVFGVLKTKINDPWLQPNIGETNSCIFIFYEDSTGPTNATHYKVALKEPFMTRRQTPALRWKIKDPYDMYQIKNSHGFCQMFAFFIAVQSSIDLGCHTIIDDKIKQIVSAACDSFQVVENADNNAVKALKYRNNTFMCLKYTIELIEYKSQSIKPQMEKIFEEIKQEKTHAIGKHMTFSEFYKQMQLFNLNSLNVYILDILYLLRISDEKKKQITFTTELQSGKESEKKSISSLSQLMPQSLETVRSITP